LSSPKDGCRCILSARSSDFRLFEPRACPWRTRGVDVEIPMRSLITRRSFLERTAMTGAAAAFIPAVLTRAQTSGMFISINNAVAPRVGPWPAVAELASKIGYGGIDSPNLNALRMLGVDGAKAFFANLKLQPTITGGPTIDGSTGGVRSEPSGVRGQREVLVGDRRLPDDDGHGRDRTGQHEHDLR
jgi:hypothetical protein